MTAPRPMHSRAIQMSSKALSLFLAVALLCPSLPSQQNTGYTFHAETDLVLVNVTVHDKSGSLVRDLKQGDFSVVEDGKPQQVVSFDIENTDALPPASVEQAKLLSSQPNALKARPTDTPATQTPTPANLAATLKDRRLIILFFDLLNSRKNHTPDAVILSAPKFRPHQKRLSF